MSYPLRVRGLKLEAEKAAGNISLSYPLRVRGLKLNPLASVICSELSYPLRVRGLKLRIRDAYTMLRDVVSFTGTWIETIHHSKRLCSQPSYPLRVRGLKLFNYEL